MSNISRRSFSRLAGMGLAMAYLPPVLPPHRVGNKEALKPKRLTTGDKIGLITPAGPVSSRSLAKAVNNMKALGLQPVIGEHVKQDFGYLAGQDEARLEDLHHMFADESVAGIWCVRGGYGCTRLLPHIHLDLIAAHPKPFIGYSDITALHSLLHERTGMITIHGPVASATFSAYAVSQLTPLLFKPTEPLKITRPLEVQIYQTPPNDIFKAYPINSGMAEGRLIGGNLTVLSAMAGTDYLPSFAGKIVFLEDIDEKPYRIDRMITQLLQSSDFGEAAGYALGIFRGCIPEPGDSSLTLEQTLRHLFEPLEKPTCYGLPFGHLPAQASIPVGICALLDATNGSLTVLENSVL